MIESKQFEHDMLSIVIQNLDPLVQDFLIYKKKKKHFLHSIKRDMQYSCSLTFILYNSSYLRRGQYLRRALTSPPASHFQLSDVLQAIRHHRPT